MSIADDFAGLDAIEFLKVGNDLREYVDAARAVQVADMRRDHRAPLPSQRNGILHMSADGEDRFGQSLGQIDFQWRDPAPQPDRARLAADDAHDGIVGGADDRLGCDAETRRLPLRDVPPLLRYRSAPVRR